MPPATWLNARRPRQRVVAVLRCISRISRRQARETSSMPEGFLIARGGDSSGNEV
jgi:hypothetical protein